MVKRLVESEINPTYSYWVVTAIYSVFDGGPDSLIGIDTKEVFDHYKPYDKQYYRGNYYFVEKSFETEDEARNYKSRLNRYGMIEGCGHKKKSKKRTKKMTEDLDYDYISFATQLAEDIYDELKEEAADDNTDIGKLYTDEYPDCFYCYFKVFPYFTEDNDVLTYRVYGDQYTKFIDERLEYVDLEGLFRSAWSDYKIDTRNKCIEIGIKFMFNNY